MLEQSQICRRLFDNPLVYFNAHRINADIVNIMSFVENDYRLFGQLFRYDIGDFGVQQIVVTVDDNIRVQNLEKVELTMSM